jgi:hypothetical protein
MTLDVLLAHLEAGREVVISWSVYPDIGPDWIGGGGRTVSVSLDGQPLDESTPAYLALTAALIARLSIPATSETVLEGEGELSREGSELVLDYAWSNTPVYQLGTNGHAMVTLPLPEEPTQQIG